MWLISRVPTTLVTCRVWRQACCDQDCLLLLPSIPPFAKAGAAVTQRNVLWSLAHQAARQYKRSIRKSAMPSKLRALVLSQDPICNF
jgi:hypothetical protein